MSLQKTQGIPSNQPNWSRLARVAPFIALFGAMALPVLVLLASVMAQEALAQEALAQETRQEAIDGGDLQSDLQSDPQSDPQSLPLRSSLPNSLLRPALSLPELPPLRPVLPEVVTTRLVLRLGQRRVFVYEGDEVKASYPVAVGKPGWETPPGAYEVMSMLQNPGWISPFTGEEIPPGPDNPLGDRWIGFWTDGQNYIGFHGTPNRDSVGQAASHGCVRMLNEHILQLYEMVDMGTPVVVEN